MRSSPGRGADLVAVRTDGRGRAHGVADRGALQRVEHARGVAHRCA